MQNVPGLLPYKKVKPTETVRRRITDVHGSLKATEVRALIEKKRGGRTAKESEERRTGVEESRIQGTVHKMQGSLCVQGWSV